MSPPKATGLAGIGLAVYVVVRGVSEGASPLALLLGLPQCWLERPPQFLRIADQNQVTVRAV